MGGCCSGDTVPPVPKNIRADPDAEQPIKAVSARLGFFGASRDFGIWHESRPKQSADQKDNIWLWFNKSNIKGSKTREVQIDLENFQRPQNGNKNQGKILYSAVFTESPNFQIFQRFANQGHGAFFGFFKSSPPDPEDNFFVNHQTHVGHLQQARMRPDFHRMHDRCIVSKWNFTSKVTLKDGNSGRGEAYFYGQQPVVEVFSKGTVVTSYYETKHVDKETNRVSYNTQKCETEFVDIVEFRMSVNNLLIAEWNIQGDSYQYGEKDVEMDNPLFHLRIDGGWFARSTFTISTKPGIAIDSALALLLAHVVATEFSVAEIKHDLKVPTPSHHPDAGFGGFRMFDAATCHYHGIQTQGHYVRGQNPGNSQNPVFQVNC